MKEEEEARTEDKAALEAEPRALFRDMGTREQCLWEPCWSGADRVTVCLHSPDAPLCASVSHLKMGRKEPIWQGC